MGRWPVNTSTNINKPRIPSLESIYLESTWSMATTDQNDPRQEQLLHLLHAETQLRWPKLDGYSTAMLACYRHPAAEVRKLLNL